MAWSYRKDAADEVYVNEPGPITFDPDEVGGGAGGGGSIGVTEALAPLVIGQSYVDVTFVRSQPDANWIFIQCQIVNTVDASPINLWPGVLTAKSKNGFRLQLNGVPDTANYFLHWAVSVITSPANATTYTLSGPTSGLEATVSAPFTVALLLGAVLPDTVTITPHDGAAGGVFTPASVALTTDSPLATFVYTPPGPGVDVISVTNNRGLSNPPNLLYTSSPLTANIYTLNGPTSGIIDVASTDFTVALPVGATLPAPVTITPNDGGAGGTFTPLSVTLSTGTPSATFKYTPTSYGAKIISTTNSSTLTNPSGLTYTSLTSTYALTGPTTGKVGVASANFMAALPPGGVVVGTAMITPNDGGVGGVFAPTNLFLTTGAPTGTFVYTPSTMGARTIATTNDKELTDPTGLGYTSTVASYTLVGPSNGGIGVASTDFTVALPGGAVGGTVVVTPSDGGAGGTFAPATVSISPASPSATFTYTPSTAGNRTVSTTNDSGLTNPAGLVYLSKAFDPTTISGLMLWLQADTITGVADGAVVDPWPDSSGNGFSPGAYLGYPTLKTNIINGKPAVHYTGSNGLNAGQAHRTLAFTLSGQHTIFAVVMVPDVAMVRGLGWFGDPAGPGSVMLKLTGANYQYWHNDAGWQTASDPTAAVANVADQVTFDWDGSNTHIWRNGVLKAGVATASLGGVGPANMIGLDINLEWLNGYVSEYLVYNVALSSTNRQAVESYLKVKWATP